MFSGRQPRRVVLRCYSGRQPRSRVHFKYMAGEQRFYTEEEAQQVLHLAARAVPSTGMSRDELVRAASEMGISAEAIEQAEAQLRAEQEQRAREEELAGLRREFNRYYRRRIFDKVVGFVSSNLFFVFLWLFTGGGYFWPIWIFGWWGVALLGSLAQSLFSAEYRERKFERWLAKRNGIVSDEAEEQEAEWGRRRRRGRWADF